MDDIIIRAANHAMYMAANRLEWYSVTKDKNHIKECRKWIDIANLCMNQIILEQKHEV